MHFENNLASDLQNRGIGLRPMSAGSDALATTGRTLGHVAAVYDYLEPLMTFGMDRAFQRQVLNSLALVGHERILDVGCGTGTLTRQLAAALADKSCSMVVGVDAAPAMIDVARQKAGGIPNIAFTAALAEDLPFTDQSFDCVVSSLFFHHINKDLKQRALAEIWRVLRPGGKVVVVDVTTPTHPFGALCVWAGYFLFRQPEIRENIEGLLEKTFQSSAFKSWRQVSHHLGYVSVFELEK